VTSGRPAREVWVELPTNPSCSPQPEGHVGAGVLAAGGAAALTTTDGLAGVDPHPASPPASPAVRARVPIPPRIVLAFIGGTRRLSSQKSFHPGTCESGTLRYWIADRRQRSRECTTSSQSSRPGLCGT
jgi:hypothetical protein